MHQVKDKEEKDKEKKDKKDRDFPVQGLQVTSYTRKPVGVTLGS